MSRTRLAVVTAAGLVALSGAVFAARRATGGVEIGGPTGTSSWEVTLTARGQFESGKIGPLTVSSPPEFRRQHVYDEFWASGELVHREGRGRETTLKPAPGTAGGKGRQAYGLTYSFRCVLGAHHPTSRMQAHTADLDGPPQPQTDGTLSSTPRIESNHREVEDLARDLAADRSAAHDQVRAFLDHILSLPYRETEGAGGALDCLRNGGDASGRSRLLVALCRSRGIPARVVTGFVLTPDAPAGVHRWAEAWIRSPDGPEGHWTPVCPTYGHLGARGWPANYLVVRLDDEPVVRGPGDPRVNLFARPLVDRPTVGEPRIRAFWRAVSLAALPPAEQHLVRFLLLLPIAAMLVSIFRVVIGVQTFGVFAPALLGLIFRDLTGLPWGLGIFAGSVLVGWVFRRVLDRYHLLLIPRAAVLLTLLIAFLIAVVAVTARLGVHVTGYVSLFPLIILTHMVERFWTVEAEDGVRSSFKTLAGTMAVAAAIALALSPPAVGRWMFRYPETLGVIVAVLLLLGRYTGYRLTELYRFQDVIEFK
jgi:hypothetical protein